ncbi:MAG: carboxylesterase family protein [Paludibacteraceae bacterium]|nr:carboxylesterase family protein [Paludibacteraceae bacterium]
MIKKQLGQESWQSRLRVWAITVSIICVAFSSAAAESLLTETEVTQGRIKGEIREGYAFYRAIPYAEAPIGALRWKAPVAKQPWAGVYFANSYGCRPPQPIDPNQPAESPLGEDCLYLSVQTPAKTVNDRLPVFVMIHGGAFLTGSYAGEQANFVREGIVYVSVEYRLGALGFMSHPELSKESGRGVSGNYGLMDQIMALQWIHDNISAFGGDPTNVTIAGESAGGISVSILCASPLCKGLFQHAISESGGSFWPVSTSRRGNTAMCTAQSAEQVGLDFQKRLHAKNIKALRKIDWQTIVDSTRMEAFWPVVDGYVITDDQYKLYERGEYNDVDVLIGTNSDEGWLFTGPYPVEAYEARIRETYGEWANQVLALYPASTPEEVRGASANIFRDGTFAWGTYAWANLQSRTGKKNVYLYYFDQSSDNMFMKSPRGANHVAEMAFIYDWHMAPFTPVEARMSEIMTRYWINFCKTGNPNGEWLPYWPNYVQGEATVMTMHQGFQVTPVPNQKEMDLFEAYFQHVRQ